MLNPLVERVVFATKALAADENVTAERPLIEPILNELPPAYAVAFEANELLSYHVPDVIADVEVESAPSSHKQQPATVVGLYEAGYCLGVIDRVLGVG
jgi:hypothetical protein